MWALRWAIPLAGMRLASAFTLPGEFLPALARSVPRHRVEQRIGSRAIDEPLASRGTEHIQDGAAGWVLPLASLAVVGLAVSRRSQRRQPGVTMYRSTFRGKRWGRPYDTGTPPPVPKWISNLQERWDFKSFGESVPEWAEEKWKQMDAYKRGQGLRWFKMAHAEDGTNLFAKRKALQKKLGPEEAIDQIFAMYERCDIKPNYDVSFEANFVFNLNMKDQGQQIRTAVTLPNGTGKRFRVAVICDEGEVDAAIEAGAVATNDEVLTAINEEKLGGFDILITNPRNMPRVAKLGRILGPKKLMPSPKAGTVTNDIAGAVSEFAMAKVLELRTKQNGEGLGGTTSRIDLAFGKHSFGAEKVKHNFNALIHALLKNRPVMGKKGPVMDMWRNISVGSSLSPKVQVDPKRIPFDADDIIPSQRGEKEEKKAEETVEA